MLWSINLLLFNILIDSGCSTPLNIVSSNKTCFLTISKTSWIVIFVSDEHFFKPLSLISVTLFGITISLSDEHHEKAHIPITITLFWI